MELNNDEINFVKEMAPKLVDEMECLKEIDTIQFPRHKDPKFAVYKRWFLVNTITYFAAKMFFMSHSVNEPNVEEEFIKYCKKYEQIMLF